MATEHIAKSYDEDLDLLRSRLIEMGREVEDQISKATRQHNFMIPQLFQAAAEIWKDGKKLTNTVVSWQEIEPALPDMQIKLMGPTPASGTYDAFLELIMEAGCRDFNNAVIHKVQVEFRRKRSHHEVHEDHEGITA